MIQKNELETTNRLLRAIVALMARKEIERYLSLKEQIKLLTNLGLKPKEISEILGRSNKYINKELVVIRKSNKKETCGKKIR